MATRQTARSRTGASGSDAAAVDPALPQKQRARHRLIGALVLCALAAVVVPLLLESEPARPVNDLPIAIPSKDTPLPPRAAAASAATPTSPAASPAANASAPATTAAAPVAPLLPATSGATPPSAPASSASSGGSAATVAGAAPKAESERGKAGAVARGTIEPVPAADGASAEASKRVEARTPPPRAEAAKDEIQQLAEARLRGETVGRYLLQVGAFATEGSANAAVGRVQAAGQRAFTERVKTERGERIRVRVGPFASREAAERARDTLKAAGIDAAMIAP
jgi:DedD protein